MIRVVLRSVDSGQEMVGRAREDSISTTDGGVEMRGAFLDFLAGDGDDASVELLFLKTLLAESRIFLAVFSSGKISLRFGRDDLAMFETLYRF